MISLATLFITFVHIAGSHENSKGISQEFERFKSPDCSVILVWMGLNYSSYNKSSYL